MPGFFYEVAPNKIFHSGSDLLTYASSKILQPGQIVIIPLGKNSLPGIVIRQVKQPNFPTKQIENALYSQALPKHLVKSALWISEYYATPLALVVQAILPRGITKKRRAQGSPDSTQNPSHPGQTPPLNLDQKRALKEITASRSNTVLLHGITGSGKTNLYIALAKQQAAHQKSTILLVPEIALTSQLIMNFQKYFPQVSVLHSKQSEAKRHLLWEEILKQNQAQIIIGPRSAIFAPVQNLGLIIIDEAHDPAYYQEQNPKYSALRLAAIQAKTVLGSATPSVLDYYLCQQKHSIVELSTLAVPNAKSTQISLIDLKDRSNFSKNRFFSNQLLESIAKSLAKNQQSLIFHNRRGSSPLTICDHCAWQALCPSCFLPLNLHSDKFRLVCHSCGLQAKVPTACPNCGHPNIIHKGFGTKQLELELNKLFPRAKIARFDADTPDQDSLKNTYKNVLSGDFNIIIGTQIIAKGFDFPKLSTLGIIQADAGLSLPDFSSAERSFQLVTQVIGRANRGHQDSNIFIQSYQPEHPAIKFAVNADYKSFYHYASLQHKNSGFPPYNFILKIEVSYKTESTTVKNINALRAKLCQDFPKLFFSRPTPSFHERKSSGFYWQLIVKSKSRQSLVQVAKSLPQKTNFRFSLDPPTLL